MGAVPGSEVRVRAETSIEPKSRRDFLKWLGRASALGVGAAALAACTKGGSTVTNPPPSGPPGSLGALADGLSQVSVLSATTPVNPGAQIFSYAMVDASNNLVTAPQTQVWLAQNASDVAIGPFTGTWYELTGYAKTGDKSPQSPLAGVYVATIDVKAAGTWTALAMATLNGAGVGGTTTLPVTDGKVVAALGSKAIPFDSPVATTPAKLAEICTRNPVCHLHSISITDALKNVKPTVICFVTPLLCQTRLCGPTLDEVILVSQKLGARVNLIHVEEFLPGKDLTPPSATLQNQSPAFKAWGFTDEPWVIVVDRKGIIRGRLGPGASVAPEIESVLKPLL